MPAAGAAEHLGAAHQEAVVGTQLNRLGDSGLGEARPAGARVELGVRAEEHRAAGRTAVIAGGLVVHVLTRERRLRSGPAEHLVLGGRQLLAPFPLGLHDLRLAHAYVLAAKVGARYLLW